MNTYSKITYAVTLSIISSMAFAVPTSEKREVLKQAKSYAQSVACSTTFDRDTEDDKTTLRDVYLVDSQEGFDGKEIGTNYVVFWSGDWGCAGGSGTYSSYLTSFSRISETRPFLIEQDDILDDVNSSSYEINPRFIEDINFDSGVMTIIASNYSNEGDDGGNNFPSNRYKYTVVYNANNGNWILTNTKFLGKNN